VVLVAQDMWGWWRRICGGGGAGYVVGEIKIKANSTQLELELFISSSLGIPDRKEQVEQKLQQTNQMRDVS
jgi:hypothetical protein